MASEEMDRALTRVKNAIKKLSAKGGVKMASEVWDVNEALPAFPVPDMSELTKDQLKTEIDKGFADVAAGRVRPAADVFAELREEYRL